MFTDTHCHLVDEFVNPADVADIIARAKSAGVGTIIIPGAEPDDAEKQIELIEKYDNIFATLGIHPEYANNTCNLKPQTSNLSYEQYLSHPKVVGIGEIGLDYHYGTEHKSAQIELFVRQLDAAIRAGLPVAIHTRDAEIDTAEILMRPEYNALGGGGVPGVMHCYTSGKDLAKKMLDRGFYFSASGILTFKNSENVREVFAMIPLDRIVIETDAPFCAPIPYRGKTCEPFMVPDTARVLAKVKGIEISKLKDILNENTKKLYPKLVKCHDN